VIVSSNFYLGCFYDDWRESFIRIFISLVRTDCDLRSSHLVVITCITMGACILYSARYSMNSCDIERKHVGHRRDNQLAENIIPPAVVDAFVYRPISTAGAALPQ